MLNQKISPFKTKYTTVVELVAVEEVDMVKEVILVEVEDMVDDEMDVDLLTDGEVDDPSDK